MTLKDTLEIGASVVASLGGGGAIVFSLSNYFGKIWADRALESQRQENARLNLELGHQLAMVTEQVKSSLQIAALEHQVRFSRLYEKRADAIEVLSEMAYQLQVKAERYALNFTRGGQESYEHIVADIRGFDAFCESHRIYLSDRMECALYEFLEAVKKPIVDIGVYSDFGAATHATLRQHSELILSAVESVTERAPAIRGALIKEFRAILDGK